MRTIEIDGKLINLEKIHFVRREGENSLLISFGTDFLKFKGNSEKIESIYNRLRNGNNEKLSGNTKR